MQGQSAFAARRTLASLALVAACASVLYAECLLRTVGHPAAGDLVKLRRHVLRRRQQHAVPHVVGLEELWRKGVATSMSLAALGVEGHAHRFTSDLVTSYTSAGTVPARLARMFLT
jgi:hypothetical protein